MESRTGERLPEVEKEDRGSLKERIWIESKKFWRVAFPAMVTRVTSYGILVVTQSFMGHIGQTELASYAVVQTTLIRLVTGFLFGMSSALETLCGQAFGAKHYHMMGIYLQRSWIIMFITTLILCPIFVFTTPIMRLLRQEEKLSQEAGKFALWFLPIMYYYLFTMSIQKYLQAQFRNSIIGCLSTASFVIHLIVSWIFVDKLNLGVLGAMVALIISSWFLVIGELVYIFGGWCPQTWKGFSKHAFSELWPVAKLSFSSGVMLCVEIWYTGVLVLVAGYMKNAEVEISAFSICLNISTWELMMSYGFYAGTSVRVANELGRGDSEAVKFAVKNSVITSLSIGTIFWILALALGHILSYAFTSSVEVAKAVSSLSPLLAFSILLNSVQPILSGVAVGAGRQAIVAYVNIICYYFVGIPLGILLAYIGGLKVEGIWIGMVCGIGVQTLALIYITWKTNWDDQVKKASERLNRWLCEPSHESNGNTQALQSS